MCKRLTFIVSFLVLALLTTSIANAALIGHWKFDHKGPSEIYAYDEVDPPHNGELAGGGVGGTDAPDWTSYGVIDGALIFDGDIRDYVNFGPDDIFDLRDAFTLACWIKVDSSTCKPYGGLPNKGGYGTNTWVLMMDGDCNNLAMIVNTDACGESWVEGTTDLTLEGDNEYWYHVAGTWDGNTAITYVDGVLDDSQANHGSLVTNTLQFIIGRNIRWPEDAYGGYVDDLRVYDNALSSGDILNLVAAEANFRYSKNPKPKDGSEEIDVSTLLTWTPGLDPNSYDIYLGSSWADVNSATTADSEFQATQTADANSYDPNGLNLAEIYYWRVDITTNDANTWKGTVWSFQTSGYAVNPFPADGGQDVSRWAILDWEAGLDANSHDVYLGTDYNDVSNADTADTNGIYRGNQVVDDNSFDPDGLKFATTYYWRIDETDIYELTHKGNIWSFTTDAGYNSTPTPADGTGYVAKDLKLTWTQGEWAASHDVYLGTSFADVNSATTADSEFKGNQPGIWFDPDDSDLTVDQTHYWRVDGIQDSNQWKGDVWSFTVKTTNTTAWNYPGDYCIFYADPNGDEVQLQHSGGDIGRDDVETYYGTDIILRSEGYDAGTYDYALYRRMNNALQPTGYDLSDGAGWPDIDIPHGVLAVDPCLGRFKFFAGKPGPFHQVAEIDMPHGNAFMAKLKDGFVYQAAGEAYRDLYTINVSDTANVNRWAAAVPSHGFCAYSCALLMDHYCVVSYREGVQILDVSDPNNPVNVADYVSDNVSPMKMQAAGNLMFVQCRGFTGLDIVDLTDPCNPKLAYYYGGSGYTVNDMIPNGDDYLYIYGSDPTNGSGLRVMNITDPCNPYEAAFYDPNLGFDVPSSYTTENWQWIDNKLIGLQGSGNNVKIWDMTDPCNIFLIQSEPVNTAAGGSITGVVIDGDNDMVYVATGTVNYSEGSFKVFTCEPNLANWTFMGAYTGMQEICRGPYDTEKFENLMVYGDYVIAGRSWYGIVMFDVSDPCNPDLVNGVATAGECFGIGAEDGRVYVPQNFGGLAVVNWFDPENPVFVTQMRPMLKPLAWEVDAQGIYAYAARRFIANVNDINNPYATYTDLGANYSNAISVDANLLTYGNGSTCYLVDVSDPCSPVTKSSWSMVNNFFGGDLRLPYLYTGTYGDGVRIYDVSDPCNPVLIGTEYSQGGVKRVAVAGNILVTSMGESFNHQGGGVSLWDISDPCNPKFLSWTYCEAYYGLAARGDYFYTAAYYSGNKWAVFDMTDPCNPVNVGESVNYYATGVDVDSEYLYASSLKSAHCFDAPVSGDGPIGWATITCSYTGGSGDSTAPKPDAMTWDVVPYALSTTEIKMKATTAGDVGGGDVEYYFHNVTNDDNSGWQSSPYWKNTGLSIETSYTYEVKARDASNNQTSYSAQKSATTKAPAVSGETDPPTPNPATWATEPYATGTTSIAMTATTGSDACSPPVEYYFEETTGHTGGDDSGWQSDPNYTDTGLSKGTEYTYRVKMRDALLNEGGWSDPCSATTLALPFSDGFESGDFDGGGWTTLDADATVDDKVEYTGVYGAKLAEITWIEKAVSTAGFTTIHVKYRRETKGFDTGENLYVEWYDGSDWNNLETIEDCDYEDGLQDKTCGAGANNNVSFKVRFRTNAGATNEYASIDDVEISGTAL